MRGDLEPGERLLASAWATFFGSRAAESSTWRPGMPGLSNRRLAYDAWRQEARAAGFPVAGMDMVVAITDRRLLVWRTSKWLGRPRELAGARPLEALRAVRYERGLLAGTLTFAFRDGGQAIVESGFGWRLRPLARAFERATGAAPCG